MKISRSLLADLQAGGITRDAFTTRVAQAEHVILAVIIALK